MTRFVRRFDVVAAKAACDRMIARAVRQALLVNGLSLPCLLVSFQPGRVQPQVRVCGGVHAVGRVALTAYLGRSVTAYALHHCDNPRCIEESHLYEGTQSRNQRDRFERGRKGPNHGRPAIDPLRVKRMQGCVMPAFKLANLIGVGRETVRRYRRLAKAVPPPLCFYFPRIDPSGLAAPVEQLSLFDDDHES